MVPRPEFGSIHESGSERCRASPASQKQVGAESVQVKDGIIPTFPRGIGAPPGDIGADPVRVMPPEPGSLGSAENAKIDVLRSSVQHFFDLRPLLGIVFQGESDYEGPRVVLTTF